MDVYVYTSKVEEDFPRQRKVKKKNNNSGTRKHYKIENQGPAQWHSGEVCTLHFSGLGFTGSDPGVDLPTVHQEML